jgi:isoaspartyl peptidase/L-asparaginase-like protein (Ntn-hydrolase superfamily)
MAAAVKALRSGRSALDAVELGIRPFEVDSDNRSVGVGGLPNMMGQPELDASIMDGHTLRAGAVAALRGFIHPISVARQVMEQLPHVLLVGEGAARFAAECGAEAGEILTEGARNDWQEWLREHVPPETLAQWPNVPLAPWVRLKAEPEAGRGTVAFMAQDASGDVAVGVSTSGYPLKYPGRVGDSPIIGAGGYADNRYGAAGCIGVGELAIRAGTARSVVLYMKMGMTVQEACHEAANDLHALTRRYRGGLNVYAIDAHGEPYVTRTEPGEIVYWIWAEGMEAPERRQVVIEAP